MGAMRELPHSHEAEQGILGFFLGSSSKEQFIEYAHLLSPSTFYEKNHQLIFESMQAVDRAGDSPDLVTVATDLQAKGKLEQAGGAAYIAGLTDMIPFTDNL